MKRIFIHTFRFLSTLLALWMCLFFPSAVPHGLAERLSQRSLLDRFLPRKPLDRGATGINAFVNDNRFGNITAQFLEVRDTLKLNQVRVLFGWDDNVQPSPSSPPDFRFYDEIARSIPEGMEAVIVLTHIPTWMENSSNWIQGDPRKTFVERWVSVVAARYQLNPRIIGYQVWNEPNATADPENRVMGFVGAPQTYLELLKASHQKIKSHKESLLVLNAATTAIGQNFPRSLSYNRRLRALGAEAFVDAWAIHLYGTNVANVIRPGGVKSFVRGIKKPVWVTESGAQGITKQREYVERYWTFFKKEMRNIARWYLYQFTEDAPPASTYGLRNPSSSQPTSDLYQYLSGSN